jgi:hypothetical protein
MCSRRLLIQFFCFVFFLCRCTLSAAAPSAAATATTSLWRCHSHVDADVDACSYPPTAAIRCHRPAHQCLPSSPHGHDPPATTAAATATAAAGRKPLYSTSYSCHHAILPTAHEHLGACHGSCRHGSLRLGSQVPADSAKGQRADYD